MKTLLCLSSLILAGALAHADLVVEQTMESPFLNGNVTMKLKGDKARIESPSPIGGQAITIVDTAAGKLTTLMPAQKMAVDMDMGNLRKQAQAALQASGADPAKLKPTATGQKQKIGDWNAEEYTVTTPGAQAMTMHFWVAADFPKGKEIQEQMSKFTKAFSPGIDPGSLNLPGMVVKSEVETPGGKIVTTVKSVKESPVPDTDFVIPADYQKMAAPAGAGGAGGAK